MRKVVISQMEQLEYSGNEALNTICTNLSFAGRDLRKVIITSCVPGEGKSFVSMHIMLNMAQRGKRVVLVDADLRRSNTINRFGLQFDGEATGLVHYLAGYSALDDVIYETNCEGGYIIPVGRDVINPISLLDTPYFHQLMEDLADNFDMVLVDAPPVGLVVDAAQIARYCDGALFVVEYGQRHRRELLDAVHQMEQSSCPVLGCVINKVALKTISEKKYYRTRYAHEYGEYAKRAEDQGKHN